MITTTSLGTHSSVIEYTAGTTPLELNVAVSAILVAGGWEETYASSTGSYDQRHFRSAHKTDANASYMKGVQLITHLSSSYITLNPFEMAPASGSGVTNLYNTGTHTYNLTTSGGKMFVFVDTTYICMVGQPDTGDAKMIGAFEFSGCGIPLQSAHSCRIAATSSYALFDSGGVCSWFRPTSATAVDGTKTAGDTYMRPGLFSGLGSFGYNGKKDNSYYVNFSDNSNLLPEHNHDNTGNVMAGDLSLTTHTTYTTSPQGMLYGVKVLNRYAGSFMDVITIKTDSNGFCNSTGTDQEYFILTDEIMPSPYGACIAIPR